MGPPDLARALARDLEPWFLAAQRPLPWRSTRDPYAIWVSEVMLQQTRVETVERYWDRFLTRFPTVGALAAADEASVLSAWSGLGYYRRARLLHRGAQYVDQELGGSLPTDGSALQKIPGVGRYTAGAIASIAYDRPEPLVDGNVARALSRIGAITEPRAQDASASHHWLLVRSVLSHGSPRILAQALMELGATICTPRAPDCRTCPVRRHCRAHELDLVMEIPVARKRAKKPVEEFLALAILWKERLLLVQRPATGLLAGLWCLPLVRANPQASVSEVVKAVLGVEPAEDPIPNPRVDHVFTHRIWQLHPWRIRVRRKPRLSDPHVWMTSGELPEGGIPSVTRKLIVGCEGVVPGRELPGSASRPAGGRGRRKRSPASESTSKSKSSSEL